MCKNFFAELKKMPVHMLSRARKAAAARAPYGQSGVVQWVPGCNCIFPGCANGKQTLLLNCGTVQAWRQNHSM